MERLNVFDGVAFSIATEDSVVSIEWFSHCITYHTGCISDLSAVMP
jgi:hypothetical protein